MTRASQRHPRRVLRLLAGAALLVFFAAMLVIIAALTFSVRVQGESMEPTLHTGDRLSVNVFRQQAPGRFDLVDTAAGAGGVPVVKRVVGMPGDRLQVRGGQRPQVLIRPAGSTTDYRVDNPSWESRVGGRMDSCCRSDGTSLAAAEPAREVVVPPGSYWVLGDNWGASDDSRVFGFVTDDDIHATVNFRILPLEGFGTIEQEVALVPVRE